MYPNPYEHENRTGCDRETAPDLSQPVNAERVAAEMRRMLDTYREPDPRPMALYRLPDGSLVRVDDTAAKGALGIWYTLKGGKIVMATREEQQP